MDCRELRIGNLIQYKENTVTVIGTSISANSTVEIKLETENEGQKFTMQIPILIELGYLSPIPLTEEWLVRFGWDKEYGWYSNHELNFIHGAKFKKDGTLLSLHLPFFNLNTSQSGKTGKSIVKYVHQLQNLYFALTGEELKYV